MKQISNTEVANLSGVISAILTGLSTLHKTAMDAINSSRGLHNPNLPESFQAVRDKLTEENFDTTDEYGNPKYLRKYGRWYENPEFENPDPNNLQKYQENIEDEKPETISPSSQKNKNPSLTKIKQAHQKTLEDMQHRLKGLQKQLKYVHKNVRRQEKQKSPTNQPSKYNRGASGPTQPQPLKYTARKTIEIKVMINGKIATTTIRKGSPYSLIKTNRGIQLIRRGQRGMVFVAPSQLAKLK
jgi:hypothetical protein